MNDEIRRRWTRREFLKRAAAAAAVGAAGVAAFAGDKDPAGAHAPAPSTAPAKPAEGKAPASRPAPKRAKVVLVRDADALDAGRHPRAEVISRMLDQGVVALTGESTAEAAWARLIRPEDTVGIKTNAWRFLNTTPEVEDHLKRRILGAGVPEERVAVDDRGVLENPAFRRATALVNARPMRTHHWAGVGSCIKNYIMFSPDPPSWHEDACANLAGLWDLPAVRDKTRLNVLVMLTPLFHGKGPHHFDPKYTWSYGGLILGTDVVAVDATGLRILEAKRRDFFGENQPFATSPKHIRVAEEKFRLGVADSSRIGITRLGWTEGTLI
jgi:uncharacterized protein DUF362